MNIKKAIASGVAIAGFLAATAVFGLPAALAYSTNSAIVIKGSACGLFDGNGVSVSTTGQIVKTSGINSTIICKAQVTPSSTKTGAVYWNFANTGFLCGTTYGFTKDWIEVVSPSGQATLQCRINPNTTL